MSFPATTLGLLVSQAYQLTNDNTTSADVIAAPWSTASGANPNDFGEGPGTDCPVDQSLDIVLGPLESCDIIVFFDPGALGARSATLTLDDSLHTNPTIEVSGTGAVGYYQVSSNGAIAHFGDAQYFGDASSLPLKNPIVGITATGDNGGYWLVGSDGGIFTYGDANYFGSTGSLRLNQPIVGMAPNYASLFGPSGYWLVAADGGIFAFGTAPFFGSTGALHLNKPIVGMAPTPDGNGYWLVAADGGIFAYGDAPFFGSTGGLHLNKPIVGMATTPDGGGYWLVASDGGVFAFGDAQFYGSTGAIHLAQPIVGMAPMPTGNGYWFTAADGGLFNFGDAPFQGAAASHPIGTVVAMATDGSPTFQAFADQPALRRLLQRAGPHVLGGRLDSASRSAP
jgi:hypothetical protein